MWLFLVGCGVEEPGSGGAPTEGDDGVVEYDNVGVACLQTRSDGSAEVLVDFGDCAFGSFDLACVATVVGDRIEVDAGGTVTDTDSTAGTCDNVAARCDPPSLGEATWTLSYAGVDVAVDTPTTDWVCTGPSAML